MKQTTSEMPSTQNSSIYQFTSVVRSGRINLTESQQSVIAKLPGLLLSKDQDDFASRLLDIFSSDPTLKSISRVGIVRRLGWSNQIEVISSANSDSTVSNTMQRGYSCFISSRGSFLSCSPGTMRIYQNVEKVLEKFESEGNLVQRSIGRVKDMGFSSGHMLPSFDGSQEFIGALFLNLNGPPLDMKNPGTCAILSLVENYARGIILDHRANLPRFDGIPESFRTGAPFDKLKLISCQSLFGSSAQWQITSTGPEFLVSHANLACLFHNLYQVAQADSTEVTVNSIGEDVSIRFAGMKLSQRWICQIASLAQALGYKIKLLDDSIEITFAYEAYQPGTFYSIRSKSEAQTQSFDHRPQVSDKAGELAAKELQGDELVTLINVGYSENLDLDDFSSIGAQLSNSSKSLGVSGVIICNSGIFLCILEGSLNSVRRHFASIKDHCRLSATRNLYIEQIVSRHFKRLDLVDKNTSVEQMDSHEFINEILLLNHVALQEKPKAWFKLVQKYLGSKINGEFQVLE